MRRVLLRFPSGAPGFGLLLLRIALATPLVYDGAARVSAALQIAPLPLGSTACGIAMASIGLCVAGGLFTPIALALVLVAELLPLAVHLRVATLHFALDDGGALALLRAISAVAVALIGPGAYSIDHRLYGPRRIAIAPIHPSTAVLERDRHIRS